MINLPTASEELYDVIYAALMEKVPADTADEKLALHHLSLIASDAATLHFAELLEKIRHLEGTVKRLSRVDTGTITG